MRNLKIGLVCAHSFSSPGGVQRHVVSLQREFKKRGLACKIIAPGRSFPDGVAEEDVIKIGVSLHAPGNASKTSMNFSLKPRKIPHLLAQEKFDILHFHNMDIGLLTVQILLASKAVNILTFHGALDGSRTARWFPFLADVLRKAYEKKFNGVIGVSEAAFKVVKKVSLPKTIIPNGIDCNHFSLNVPQLSRFQDGKKNILFVGRFEKRKGLLYLLRAYEELCRGRRDLRLIIVGDGAMRPKIEAFVRDRSLPNICFEGTVPEDMLPSYYRTAAIFCAPSLYGESFGMVLLEAMACGTPVVGFANEGYVGVLRKTDSCDSFDPSSLLAKPKDWQALAEKMDTLLQDRQLYQKAQSWGLKRCQEFSWEKVAEQVLEFYMEVLEQKQ